VRRGLQGRTRAGEVEGGGDRGRKERPEQEPEECPEAGGGQHGGQFGGPALAQVAPEPGHPLPHPLGGHGLAAGDLFQAFAVALPQEPLEGLLVALASGQVALGPAEQVGGCALVRWQGWVRGVSRISRRLCR
jgi:hypothetical protein